MSILSRRAVLAAAPLLLVPGVARAALMPTPRASEGPFYPVELPPDDDNDLLRVAGAADKAGGDILHLAGAVLDRNAKPVAGVRVELWQCDVNGVYLHPRDRRFAQRDPAFQGFGHARSRTDGTFTFRTIVPVPYPGRTPHIHLKVVENGRDLLTTQFYRAGFPQNASDFLFRRLAPEEQERVSMVLTPREAPRPAFETAIKVVLAA